MIDIPSGDPLFVDWLARLEARHLQDLTFAEVARALRALSSAYVERRHRLAEGGALAGAGKRAAFALFYGPLHFLLVHAIVRSLPAIADCPQTLVDLGCGTGAAAAAWAAACVRKPEVLAIDRSSWALVEARSTCRAFGVRARTLQGDLSRITLPGGPSSVVAAFTLNELEDGDRDQLLTRLMSPSRTVRRVLIVEPIARSFAPWWSGWRERVVAAGGRADEWRFPFERPPILEKFDRAAGMDHRELTGRSLYFTASRR